MGYLGAPCAVLVAAMTISITPLGRTAWASDDNPVVRSGLERNTILPFSASSSAPTYYSIKRYGGKDKKPVELFDAAEFHECTDVTVGAWTYTDTKDCGKEKCGKVTTRTVTYPVPACHGTFPFAAIFYEWTAHNNQRITDTFDATWTSPDYTIQFTFNITVPVVRPDHEKTVFERWWPDNPTAGEWKQKLVPPSSDKTFDFSGEVVREAVGGVGNDSCWSDKSHFDPAIYISGGEWTVKSGNVWKPDQVGWLPEVVTYYRNPTPYQLHHHHHRFLVGTHCYNR